MKKSFRPHARTILTCQCTRAPDQVVQEICTGKGCYLEFAEPFLENQTGLFFTLKFFGQKIFAIRIFEARFFSDVKFLCPEIFARENFKARNFSANKIFTSKKFCVSERHHVGGLSNLSHFFHDQAEKFSR